MPLIDLTDKFTQTGEVTGKRGWAIHHSAGPEKFADPRAELEHIAFIDRYHRGVRGFSMGIGYHVVVFESGNAYRVGKPDTVRAHVADRNHQWDGLCFIGSFVGGQPSDRALATARAIINADPLGGELFGHRDLMPLGYTTCPGTWDINLLRVEEPVTKPPRLTNEQRIELAIMIATKQHPVPHEVRDDGWHEYIVRIKP